MQHASSRATRRGIIHHGAVHLRVCMHMLHIYTHTQVRAYVAEARAAAPQGLADVSDDTLLSMFELGECCVLVGAC